MNKDNSFEYTYSAKRQEEIEQIRKKYVPAEEDKMDTLRRLDRSVEKKGTVVSLLLGIIGTLIFGGGMSMTMMCTGVCFFCGIGLGIIGGVVLGIAYPVYMRVVKKEREKIAPQILALAEELGKM